jgi:hypothetical protein
MISGINLLTPPAIFTIKHKKRYCSITLFVDPPKITPPPGVLGAERCRRPSSHVSAFVYSNHARIIRNPDKQHTDNQEFTILVSCHSRPSKPDLLPNKSATTQKNWTIITTPYLSLFQQNRCHIVTLFLATMLLTLAKVKSSCHVEVASLLWRNHCATPRSQCVVASSW